MTGTTDAGRVVVVFARPGKVWFGNHAPAARNTWTYPLTPQEARNIANWLNGAADEAEKTTESSDVTGR